MLLRLDCYTRSPEVGHGGLHFLACVLFCLTPITVLDLAEWVTDTCCQ